MPAPIGRNNGPVATTPTRTTPAGLKDARLRR